MPGPSRILIHEVGLRDGLQMEGRTVPTEKKLVWLRRLLRNRRDRQAVVKIRKLHRGAAGAFLSTAFG